MNVLILSTIILAKALATPLPINLQYASNCPYYLPSGSYEFPHLIVPTNKSNIPIGHSYFAEVSPINLATIFNFDIPPSRANQQCSVYFTLPRHDQLVTSDFKWNGNNSNSEGPGTLQLEQFVYDTGANDATTGNSEPPLNPDPASNLTGVVPGTFYKAWSGSCGPGGVMSWKLSSPDSSLLYFQDWNACAIGLWVVYENSPIAVPPEPSCGNCPDAKTVKNHAEWMEGYAGLRKAKALVSDMA